MNHCMDLATRAAEALAPSHNWWTYIVSGEEVGVVDDSDSFKTSLWSMSPATNTVVQLLKMAKGEETEFT